MNWELGKKYGRAAIEIIIVVALAALLWRMVFLMNAKMLDFIITNFVSAVMLIIFGFGSLYLLNRFTPKLNFEKELEKENMAVAMVLSIFILSIALILALL